MMLERTLQIAGEGGLRIDTAKNAQMDTGGTSTDYGLSKLFYDLQAKALADEYRADRAAVMARYQLEEPVRRALLDDDMSVLAPRVNAYLLRYYFGIIGMADATFIARIRETANG